MAIRKTMTMAAVSAASACALTGFAAAPSQATAVVTNNPLACDTDLYEGNTTVNASVGDTFTLNFVDGGPRMPGAGGCAETTLEFDAVNLSATIGGVPFLSGALLPSGGDALVFTVLSTAVDGAGFMTLETSGATVPARTVAVTITGGSSSSTASDEVGPPSWHKAYQRAHKEEACQSGWNPSYAMWANNNSGGWVCVQELYYSGGTWLTR